MDEVVFNNKMKETILDIDDKLYDGNVSGLRKACVRLFDTSEKWFKGKNDRERLKDIRIMRDQVKHWNVEKLSLFSMKLLDYVYGDL